MSAPSRATRVLFTAWFHAAFLVYSAVAIPALALLVTLVSLVRPRRATLRVLRHAIRWYGLGVIRVLPLGRVRVEFTDEEPAHALGGSVVVMNHRSASDPFLVALLRTELIQVVNIWPMRLPLLGPVARLAGYLSIREMPVEDFMRRGAELLAAGVTVVAFPEGTRSGSRALGSFHSTVFRLARAAGAPIVPVCIAGNERLPPKGSLMLEPGRIRLVKLPAVRCDDAPGDTAFALKQFVRERLAARLAALDGAA